MNRNKSGEIWQQKIGAQQHWYMNRNKQQKPKKKKKPKEHSSK